MRKERFSWGAALGYVYGGHAWDIFWMIFFYSLAAIPFWASPVLIARLIDLAGMEPGARMAPFMRITALLVGVVLLNYPMALLHYRFGSTACRNAGRSLRIKICRQLQQLSLLYHNRTNIGRLQTKAIRDIEIIERFPRMFTGSVFSVLFVMAAAFVNMALRAPSAFLMFLVMLVPAVGVSYHFRKKFKRSIHQYRSSMEDMSSGLHDMLTMIPVTRAHGLEEFELANVKDKIDHVAKKGRVFDIVGGSFGAGAWVSMTTVYSAFVALSVYMCFQGHMSVGDVVMFSTFFSRLSGNITGLLHLMPELSQTKEAIYSIKEILDAPDREENERKAVIKDVEGAVSFEDVTYHYPDTDKAGVNGFSFDVRPGESVALIGTSGCGKSTTLSLLLGFVRPQRGRILLDGRDMNGLDLRHYRRSVGVVTQDTVFFSGTIRENVAYGLPDIPDTDIIAALEKAQAMEFIGKLPDGLDTRIGADGITLSGGQRQRLSIARALVRDPKVLIFDEATSALDVPTETLVQDALVELMKGRTSFIVAHRMSTVKNADRIIILDKGRVVAEGTPEELAAGDNYYTESIRMQTQG